jgi:plastocyanin
MMRLHGWLAILLLVLAGCGGGAGSECDAPRTPSPLDRASTGTIAGTVTLAGTPPSMATLRMTAECAAQHPAAVPTGDVVVHDGRVENAYVYIKDGLGERVFAAPAEPVVIDQVGCVYRPHVVGVQTCQPITFKNSDSFLHNVHGTPTVSSQWNFSMGVQGSTRTVRIPKPEVPVEVRCDVHPWMRAYVAVSAHPYFAVTGADGRFVLRDVPAGDYLVASWHERFGTRETRVTLGAKDTKDLAFAYAAP